MANDKRVQVRLPMEMFNTVKKKAETMKPVPVKPSFWIRVAIAEKLERDQ